jgi:LuxR family maltose regulon positive regulatory protein
MGSRTAAGLTPPLITTKLNQPVPRVLVHRAGLVARLEADAPHKLTLIRAPAGWGKSTLLADWHASTAGDGRRFAWLTLDTDDNAPVRFWSYVIAAVQTVEPTAGAASLSLLRAPGTSLLTESLPVFLNELMQMGSPLTLVLEDYHLIRTEAVHESLTFLLEHMPPTLEVVIASRTEPPLPLARLRARGELLEIDAVALRFTEDETDALLNRLNGLGVGRRDVSRLAERTEGWAAGLYLAALSLRDGRDAGVFIDEFTGDDRHVVDYLTDEVLDSQTPEAREFLLRTAILDRMCAPLCEAVAGTGSADLLFEIERSNLFLVPLDHRREWYRYHHLFSELLRHELELSHPDLVPELHRRAAAWLIDQGDVSAAIGHSAAAGDLETAGELIATHWNVFLNQGHVETVAGWLDRLPAEDVAADARLCLARAGTFLTLGRNDEAEGWLDAAAAAEAALPVGAASVEAEAAIYRAVSRYRSGDMASALDAAQRAVDLERDDESPWRAMAYAALGRSLYWVGDPTGAQYALAEAIRLAQPPGNTLSVLGAMGYLAALHVGRGELDEAEALIESATALGDAAHFSEHWVTTMVLVARGHALAARGDLDAAGMALARGLDLARRGAGAVELAQALLALAELRGRCGDPEAATALLREAGRTVRSCPDPGILADELTRSELALRAAATPAPPAAPDELTGREVEVLRLLATRLSQRDIGRELYVSLNTVKSHTRAIFRKLGVSTRPEAVARARELGLL